MILRNEFAAVEVLVDESANGPTLLVRDLEHGTEIRLDVLELESLTRLSHEDLAPWVRPE
ncbi:MAG: hypothetical protein ABR591_02710 [Candidatus Velthaea sp.]